MPRGMLRAARSISAREAGVRAAYSAAIAERSSTGARRLSHTDHAI